MMYYSRNNKMLGHIPTIIFLVIVASSCTTCDDTVNDAPNPAPTTSTSPAPPPVEPAFPEPLDFDRAKVEIVSQSYDGERGFETISEYLDLDQARAAYVTRNKIGMHVNLLDALKDKSYSYRPYTCDVRSQKDVVDRGWFHDYNHEEKNLRLFGVTGAWLYAASRPKQYSGKQKIHVVSRNTIEGSHMWSLEDAANNVRIELYFAGIGPLLALEMVRFLSNEDQPKVLTTYNVLSVKRAIDQYSLGTFLEVPVGYGCMSDIGESQYDDKLDEDSNLRPPGHSLGHRLLELEVTATKFDYSSDQQMSDTQTVELARDYDLLLLVRDRDTRSDRKRVFDRKLNVMYDIDLRQGSCKLNHFSQTLDQASNAEIDFANDLKLHVSPDIIRDLFDKKQDFRFVKRVQQEDSTRWYVFFERSGSLDVFSKYSTQPTRIIRRFEEDKEDYELDSVTIWILNSEQTRIEEMYYLNIIDMRPATKKIYDVSEECYLNNVQMKEGRDYAWFEFTYPMPNQLASSMVTHLSELKDELWKLYEAFFDARGARLPRLELTLEDDNLKARLLALDLPPFEIMFEKRPSTSIAMDKPEHDEMTVDLRHCADLCRRYDCHVMTFCSSEYKCLFTAPDRTIERVDPVSRRDIPCDSYVDTRTTYESSLHTMVSLARRLDYSPVALPKPEDELILPDTDIDQAQLDADEERYRTSTLDLIRKERPGLQELSLVMKIESGPVVLVPNGFQVEADPLAQFDLVDSDSQDSDDVPAFHQGLAFSRYNRAILSGKKNAHHHFESLSYDQCAMACTDTKCGSFSYCRSSKDCIVTSINNTVYAQTNNLVVSDKDCFIMQRDFLRNFNRFPNVFRPSKYQSVKKQVSNPSVCALECVSRTDYRCLAFDYCEDPTVINGEAAPGGTCFFQLSRHMTNVPKQPDANLQPRTDSNRTGCSHYSRSSLAEFIHIESHQIAPSVKEQLSTTKYTGKSLFQCAELCVMDLGDCSAFEFCLSDQQSTMQSCEMIQSKLPKGKIDELSVVVDESSDDNVTSVGKLLITSESCHLYALRKDSTAAQLRDLAISAETLHDKIEAEQREANKDAGLTFGKGLILYLSITVVSGLLGLGVCFAKDNDYVRQKVERAKILIRR